MVALTMGGPTVRAEEEDRSPCLKQCQDAVEACMAEAGDDADKRADCATSALSCIEACGVTLPS